MQSLMRVWVSDSEERGVVHVSLVAQVLQGTKLMFSRLWPTDVKSQEHHLWQMAERLGAECSTVLDDSVTHVVTNTKSTAKVRRCSLSATLPGEHQQDSMISTGPEPVRLNTAPC